MRVIAHSAVLILLAAAPVLGLAGDRPRVRHDLLVSTAWLERHLGDRGLVILQAARACGDYDAGHIPGALCLPFEAIAADRDGLPNQVPPVEALVATIRGLGIDQTSRVILYDDGAGLLAARAYVVLDYLGLGDRAALLDGHLPRWRAEGRPLDTAAPGVAPSAFTPRLRPEVIIGFDAVRDLSWTAAAGGGRDGAALLDARPEPQYRGDAAGDGIARPGHIPGAASLYWVRTVRDREDPVLRPAGELRDLFAAAGVRPGDTVVSYCRSGIQASHTYFVARYLGYDPRLYDGSFYEWSGRDDAPVEPPPATPGTGR